MGGIVDDPLERRRRQREAKRRRMLTGGIIGAGVLVAVLVVALAVAMRGKLPQLGGPSESSEGESWTHKDLADYLGKHGLQVEIKPLLDFTGTPVSRFTARDGESVEVWLHRSPKEARERAGSMGGNSFAWGRFAIMSKSDLGTRIRAVLKVRD